MVSKQGYKEDFILEAILLEGLASEISRVIKNKQLVLVLKQAGIVTVMDLVRLTPQELITINGIGVNRYKKMNSFISRLKRAITLVGKRKKDLNLGEILP